MMMTLTFSFTLRAVVTAAILATMLTTSLSLAYAETARETEKKGFWWYEEKPTEEEEEAMEQYEMAPLPSMQVLSEMHPLEIKKELEDRKVYAVWKQTPEAVLDYYKVQDVVRRHALAFTALTKYVMLKNPELNARSAFASSGAGRDIETQVRNDRIQRSLSGSRDDYALIMFSSPGCPYCASQINVLKYFADRHHWVVDDIDISRDHAMKSRFNITTTPMTILIERGSERWMPIAVGLESVAAIEDNAYRAVRLLKGEISPKQYFTTEYQDGGFADTVVPKDDL